MSSTALPPASARAIRTTVLVAALGYFVDIYDLLLFAVVRVTSLRSLGVPADRLLDQGVLLINLQMVGMLLGGVLWGVLGDKRGRLSVLFGSIVLYSLANLANATAHSVAMYGLWRFLAGVGLAGELGAGVTLVSEMMPARARGYGTTIVAAVGLSGAVVAALVGRTLSWRSAYVVGGCLGLLLLLARVSLFESGMFHKVQGTAARRGDLRMLFGSGARLGRYVACILTGVPIWFVVGILVTFSPEMARAMGATGPVAAGTAVLWCYAGLIVGDVATGLISQALRSRRKVVAGAVVLTAAVVAVYLHQRGPSPAGMYVLCAALGLGAGYWAVFVTVAAEQFGTNLRATVTTTVPNFVRGSVVPLTFAFKALQGPMGLLHAAALVGAVSITLALASVLGLSESFGRELDYLEHQD